MRDAPRLGLAAAPLPLVAAYVQPLTGVRVFLILIEAEAILKNGIALTDVKTFVGSDSGAKFVQTPAIRSLFVPLGPAASSRGDGTASRSTTTPRTSTSRPMANPG